MGKFEQEFSNFPVQKITRHYFKNIDDNIAPIVNEINALRAQGLYSQAANLIQENFNTISHYIVDAVTYRTWEEEIYNTQKYARQKQQSIFFDESDTDFDGIEGDVWAGGD